MRRAMLTGSCRLCLAAALAVVLLTAQQRVLRADIETTAEGLTVVIDAGHGGFDGGAVGVNGTVEAGLNLAVAQQLAAVLASRGVVTQMTRTDENALGETKSADMQRRKELLNDPRADAAVSIHMNIFSDASVRGAMVYYMQGSREGQALAACVIDAVTSAAGQKRRDPNPGDYFIVRECKVPAVIVECGFLSNPEEERLLADGDYQRLLAEAIADGVLAYFEARGQ